LKPLAARPWLCLFFCTLSSAGCGWVDATGQQGNVAAPAPTELPELTIRDGGSLALNEESTLAVMLSGTDARVTGWQWTAVDESADAALCENRAAFDPSLLAPSLSDACTQGDACELFIDELVVDGVTRFNLRAPTLHAPAVLNYQLTANGPDAVLSLQQTLCLASINEAPSVGDDRYIVMRDQTRVVRADDTDNLLANDADDNDIRNLPLRIDTVPVQAPRHAEDFQLRSDGSFLYRPSARAPLATNGSVSDSFIYAVSDGTHIVNATVTLVVVQATQAPENRPPVVDDISNRTVSNQFTYDVSVFFDDPDNDTLRFTAVGLPPGVSIDIDGVIRGRASARNRGEWFIVVTADDARGGETPDGFRLLIR